MRSGSSEACCCAQKPAVRPLRCPWSFLTQEEDPRLAFRSEHLSKSSLVLPLGFEQPFVLSLDCVGKKSQFELPRIS